MARNTQLSRALKIKDLLEQTRIGMSINQLRYALQERGYEISKRTLYRDIEALSLAGVQIYQAAESSSPQTSLWRVLKY